MRVIEPIPKRAEENGFSLTELMITIVIVGTLSAVALPNYMNQARRAEQNEAVSILSQLQNTLVAYVDEYRTEPAGWADLSDISAVMTSTGVADATNFSSAITLPGEKYTVTAESDSGQYTLVAEATDGSNRNVMACVDLNNGASDLKKGNADAPATTADLVCW